MLLSEFTWLIQFIHLCENLYSVPHWQAHGGYRYGEGLCSRVSCLLGMSEGVEGHWSQSKLFLFHVRAHICDSVSIRSHLTSRSRLSSNLLALSPITLGAMSDFWFNPREKNTILVVGSILLTTNLRNKPISGVPPWLLGRELLPWLPSVM